VARDYSLVLSYLKRTFTKPINPRILVVEVEKGLSRSSFADEQSIASLKHHPGFVALTNKLRFKRQVLEAQLKSVRHESIRDVDNIQSRIFGLGYLESEVDSAVGNLRKETPREADEHEVKWFNEISAAIQGIGNTNPE
jgi:hypothetical protein